jgi:hypothetical protein
MRMRNVALTAVVAALTAAVMLGTSSRLFARGDTGGGGAEGAGGASGGGTGGGARGSTGNGEPGLDDGSGSTVGNNYGQTSSSKKGEDGVGGPDGPRDGEEQVSVAREVMSRMSGTGFRSFRDQRNRSVAAPRGTRR